MAEEKEEKKASRLGIIKRIQIPKFLVPSAILKQLENLMVRSGTTFSAREWMGIFTTIGLMLFIIASILSSILVGVGMFLFSMILMFVIPKMKADSRSNQVEAFLPDALHHMSVAIRTGLVLESVIQEISEADYGALSEEFSQITAEMRRGRTLKDALIGFSKRTGSKQIERSMRLLLEGVESGGPISDVLEEVADDMRSVRMIQRERQTSTSQQISFLAMASLMAGPFVMGVVASLPQIMERATAGLGEAKLPLKEIYSVVDALTVYTVAQAMSAALMMGVVMFGDMKKGMQFMIPMGIIAYIVFAVVRIIIPSMVASF